MNTKRSISLFAATVFLIWSGALASRADTHYVWRDNPTPVSNYTSWANASTQIQWAVDEAGASDVVLVTNGTYDTGARGNPNGYAMTNRVVITGKAITLRSVNGPDVTIIEGAPDAGTGTNGSGAIRCVWLDSFASLIGFTLTNGYTTADGDVNWMQSGGGLMTVQGGMFSNCVISGNHAQSRGGGIKIGGGTVNNCTISGNTAGSYGGGICVEGTDAPNVINNCTISGNSAQYGGGVSFLNAANVGSTLNNCLIVSNDTSGAGSGVEFLYADGTVRNCLIKGNGPGGGWWCVFIEGAGGLLENCTIVGNNAGVRVQGGTGVLTNCVVWDNVALGTTYNISVAGGSVSVGYTCSDPVQSGTGNTGADPQFVNTNAGNYRLSANSPCVNTGTNGSWTASSVDLDGRQRIRYGTVDMGAYETIYKGTMFSFH